MTGTFSASFFHSQFMTHLFPAGPTVPRLRHSSIRSAPPVLISLVISSNRIELTLIYLTILRTPVIYSLTPLHTHCITVLEEKLLDHDDQMVYCEPHNQGYLTVDV